jgi:hypothetical protein
MPMPVVQPNCVCLKTEPGESRVTYVTIAQAPSSAQVTASISNGGPLVTLKHLVALKSVRRPFTEEEIAELPPFPPSIRRNARNQGTTEIQEIARAEDGGPLTVSAGVMVQVAIEFLAPPQAAPPVTVATLVIEGTTWERVEVPLCFLTGSTTWIPDVEPTSIRLAAEPGETLTQDVVIARVRQAATMLAYIENGDSVIRIKAVIAYRPVRKEYTEDELNELPPFPPNIREDCQT